MANKANLGRNDSLVLYTDGITEARHDGELFGEARVIESLASSSRAKPDKLLKQLVRDVLAFSDGALRDDAALLAVRSVVKDAAE